jgi:Arabinose efflux permease
MFRSLAVRNYRLWFGGALVSNTGAWMQRIAQDWLVLTQLTDDDATAVGLTMALNFAPQLLLVPLTGVVADRFNRRTILFITQIAMALLGLGLGILTVTGVVQLWMVFAFALGLGLASAFDAPVRQAFVSELVPADKLANAVSLNAVSFNMARLVGPAVAGLLVAALGSGPVFLINSASFVGVFLALALLRRSEFETFTRPKRGNGLRDGFRYVRGRPDIMLVMVLVFLMGTFGFNFSVFLATMARVEFDRDADVFGVLSSVLAVGSIAGALLAARRERPRLRTIALAGLGFGVGLGAGALAPNIYLFGATLVVTGFCSLTMMTTANAYVQTTTRPSMRGRVMALYLAIFLGGTPLGAPVVGLVADSLGPRYALGVGMLAGFLSAAIAAIFYVRTREVKVRFVRRRWPLRLEYGASARDRELATTEIAIVEAETQRT